MTPFFIISPPRSKATLLMRMLDATPHVRCAGESDGLLVHLRRLHEWRAAFEGKHADESWPRHRCHATAESWDAGIHGLLRAWINPPSGTTHYGLRSTFLGREKWEKAVDWWSWIMDAWPEAKLVFLTRDQGEIELSMAGTKALWQPAYGACYGCVGGRVHHFLRSMADFHAMNPARTTLLDAADLADFDRTRAALAHVSIPLAWGSWREQLADVSGSLRQLDGIYRPTDPPPPPVEDHPAFRPETTLAEARALLDPPPEKSAFEKWQEDPFGDRRRAEAKAAADIVLATHHPKPPLPFIELPAPDRPRAIVYPWLSAAAVWGELKFSLRSLHENFTDRDCPVFILGDRRPDWLAEHGRVRFVEMRGYRKNRRHGLFEAFMIGLQLADEVLWMNDDIHFLRPTGWEDFREALTEGKLTGKEAKLLESDNGWRRGLGRAVLDLRKRGHEDVMRFATHTPFLFERRKSLEILRSFHLPYKGGWVTLYHNYHRTPHRPCAGLKVNRLPAPPEARFLNYNNHTLSGDLKEQIAAAWPNPAPWESRPLATTLFQGCPPPSLQPPLMGADQGFNPSGREVAGTAP